MVSAPRQPQYMECSPLPLIFPLLLLLSGGILLSFALRRGRRFGLLSISFWATFREYPRYRVRRLWPLAPALGGLILLMYGVFSLFNWILEFYASRLGHPLSPG
jgi:hypothetical protein